MVIPLPDWCTPHTVTVEKHLGAGAYGDTYDPPVEVACWREETRKLVRDKNGEEVVSEVMVVVRPEHRGLFAVDSRVVVDGRTTYVLSAGIRDGMGFWDQVEVNLT